MATVRSGAAVLWFLPRSLFRKGRDRGGDCLPLGTCLEWRHGPGTLPEPQCIWEVTGHRQYFDVPHVELTNRATGIVKLVSYHGLALAKAIRVLDEAGARQ